MPTEQRGERTVHRSSELTRSCEHRSSAFSTAPPWWRDHTERRGDSLLIIQMRSRPRASKAPRSCCAGQWRTRAHDSDPFWLLASVTSVCKSSRTTMDSILTLGTMAVWAEWGSGLQAPYEQKLYFLFTLPRPQQLFGPRYPVSIWCLLSESDWTEKWKRNVHRRLCPIPSMYEHKRPV